jgi:[ribosomal protein S5]-alanine N-acetyltransferase
VIAAPNELATARLRLRRPTSRDAEAVFTYAGDPTATRYMAWPRHRTVEDSRAYLAHAEDEWRRSGVGAYLLLDRADTVIGSTGLHLATPYRGVTGYILAPSWWGQGLATEAATAMVDLSRALAVFRLEAECVVEHLASARVLEKIGMQFEGIRRGCIIAPNLSPEPVDTRSYAMILK